MDALLRWDDYRPTALANFNEKRDGADCEGEHSPPTGLVANPLATRLADANHELKGSYIRPTHAGRLRFHRKGGGRFFTWITRSVQSAQVVQPETFAAEAPRATPTSRSRYLRLRRIQRNSWSTDFQMDCMALASFTHTRQGLVSEAIRKAGFSARKPSKNTGNHGFPDSHSVVDQIIL
jgi:hypothetical protein